MACSSMGERRGSNAEVPGSSPGRPAEWSVAQWLEQMPYTHQTAGSTPA